MNITDAEKITLSLLKKETLLGLHGGRVFAGAVPRGSDPAFGQKSAGLIGDDVIERFL